MKKLSYCALIRTFNSEKTFPDTLKALDSQSIRPIQYVIVDSGSTDKTLTMPPLGATIHSYVGEVFNYSDALNQGVDYVETEFVMIVSSHTVLANPEAIAFAMDVFASCPKIGAQYFCGEGADKLSYHLIESENFNGFNGVWNTCGIFRTALLKERRFRTEVFSAEDQEWSKWLLFERNLKIARISGGHMLYNNAKGHHLRKWLGEYVSVALFTRTELMNNYWILRVAYRIIKLGTRWRERYYNFSLFIVLIALRISPDGTARYFDWPLRSLKREVG